MCCEAGSLLSPLLLFPRLESDALFGLRFHHTHRCLVCCSGSDVRTAAADDMLLAVATEGTSLMEAAVQSIGNHLRQLDSGASKGDGLWRL